MNSRSAVPYVVAFIVAMVAIGCGGRIDLRPGRDAFYQVTNQVVPAQSSGSHSQTVSLETSGTIGDFDPVYPTTVTTAGDIVVGKDSR